MRTFCPQIGVDVNAGFSRLNCSFPEQVLKNCDGENGSVFTGVCFSATLMASLHKPSFSSLTGDCPTRNLFFFLRIVGGVLNFVTFGVVEQIPSSSPLPLCFFAIEHNTDVKLALCSPVVVLNPHQFYWSWLDRRCNSL